MTSDKCPVCGSFLDKKIMIGSRDEIIVSCEKCGKYGMTAEYDEDYIKSANPEYILRIKTFLYKHKTDQQRPFISRGPVVAPKGFKNYQWSAVAVEP